MTFVKTAYDISRKKVFYCDEDDSLSDIAHKMHTNNIGSIIVCKDKEPVGIITVNGMLREMTRNVDAHNRKAKHVMSSPIVTADRRLEVNELVDKFNEHGVSRMVLTNSDGKIVGIVRDIAVFKYMTFYKYDRDARNMFSQDYLRNLY